MSISKTRAGELARRARRHGYFEIAGGQAVWVKCPQCQLAVDAYVGGGKSVLKSLDAAVVSHLLMDCEAGR